MKGSHFQLIGAPEPTVLNQLLDWKTLEQQSYGRQRPWHTDQHLMTRLAFTAAFMTTWTLSAWSEELKTDQSCHSLRMKVLKASRWPHNKLRPSACCYASRRLLVQFCSWALWSYSPASCPVIGPTISYGGLNYVPCNRKADIQILLVTVTQWVEQSSYY